MTAYYNEFDPYAATWLRNLVDAGLIARGEVDTRSIVDVRPGELAGYTQCHFFAGIGGWSYALRLAGWPDDRPVWTGSCPCQPFSLAGAQKGFDDSRHLWPEFKRLIAECRPPVVFGEQVASATEWLGLVRGDLEEMGYAVGAMPIQAASAGADHLRDRYWFVADADDAGSQGRRLLPERAGQRPAGADGVAEGERGREVLGHVEGQTGRGQDAGYASPRCEDDDVANPSGDGAGRGTRGSAGAQGKTFGIDGGSPRPGPPAGIHGETEWVIGADGKARRVKSGVRLLAHGVPARVGKLRGFGNAIDPRPAREFIGAYMSASCTFSSQDRGRDHA